jgi:alanyl-tRNA synthetase
MSSEKLYQSDCYITEVNSKITNRYAEGKNQWVVLDPVLFYPGGGGQAPDRGWIDEFKVRESAVRAGVPRFLVAGNPPDQVKLKLDWDYRYANMRQHTGQHILSAVLNKLFAFDTMSVHLGNRETLIELSSDTINADQIESAETEANRVIQKNLPVQTLSVDKNDLTAYTIRRDVKSESDTVRLIRIGEYDLTGCGGTHVNSTAEIGLIKIIGFEKIRGRIRIAALIGAPAYQYYNQLHSIINGLTKDLSCAIEDIPGRVSAIMQDYKDAHRVSKGMTARWIKEYVKGLEPEGTVGYFILQEVDSSNLAGLAAEWICRYEKPLFAAVYQNAKHHFILHSGDRENKSAKAFLMEYGDNFSLKGGGSDQVVRGMISRSKIDQRYSNELIKCLHTFFYLGE